MKKTLKVKLLLILLSALLVLSGAIFIVLNNKKASADATAITAVSVAKGSTDSGYYRYDITFTGYTGTGNNYRLYNKEVASDKVVLPDYVLINGKSVTYWNFNSEYRRVENSAVVGTVTSWTFERFPANSAGSFYEKMPIIFQANTAGTAIKLLIHTSMYDVLKTEYGLVDIQVLKGLNLENGSYTLGFDSNIFTIKSDRSVAAQDDATIVKVAPTDTNITVGRWRYSSSKHLYYFNVYFEGFNDAMTGGAYAVMDKTANKYKANLLLINGVSSKYINNNTDISGYANWTEFPYSAGEKYQKPFLYYNDESSSQMEIRIKEEWWADNKVNNSMSVSFAPHVYILKNSTNVYYVLTDEVKFIRNSAMAENANTDSISYAVSPWIDTRTSAVVNTESNANRPYSSAEKTYYFNVNFAGFTTTGYDVVNVAAVTDNILVNGKTVTEINNEYATAAAGWTWGKFPQNAAAAYAKPILNYVGEKGVMQMQMHEELYNALKAEYGLIDVTVKDGFTFGGYTVDGDCAFVLNGSNVFLSVNDSSIHVIGKSGLIDTWGIQNDLYYFNVNIEGFESSIGYSVMESSSLAYYMNLIKVNGVSIKEVNATTDVSKYSTWGVYPQSASATYQKPFLFLGNTAGKMTIKIKNDWWDANKYGNSMQVSIVPNVYITTSAGDIYVATEEITYLRDGSIAENTGSDSGWIERSTLTEVTASGVSFSVDNNASRPYSQSEKLYFFNIGFAGFIKTASGYDEVNGINVYDYIKINDRTLTDINNNTDVTDWEWLAFPQDSMAAYRKPVLNYVSSGTPGVIQMRMHENLYFSMNGVEFTLCAGLNLNGYILTEDKEMVFKEASDGSSSSFINESDITYIYPGEISVSRWQPLKDVIYFDINYAPFQDGTNYKMMDQAAYYYLANLIHINGMSMRYWNLRTDVSGYAAWETFPSTAGATYQKPFVTLISNGKMEVRIKLDWWNANKGDNNSIEISVVPGTFISANDKIYGVAAPAVFYSNPAFDGYTPAAWPNAYGNVVEGASVRLINDAYGSGIRFTGEANKALVDSLVENGADVKFMMKLNKAGSAKDVYKECTTFIEDNGYYKYNAVIVGIGDASFETEYTAQPFLRVTYADSHVDDIYLGTTTRSISIVATRALNDLSDTRTGIYIYQVIVEGNTRYSPYSPAQRAILNEYAGAITVEVNGQMFMYNKESNGNFMTKSGNADVDEFVADYADRYLYINSGKYMTSTAVGDASLTWKDWEATSISYINSNATAVNNTAFESDINNAVIDKYGYVWESESFFGQGWDLPDYFGRSDTSSSFELDGWEFKAGRLNSHILAYDAGATGTWGACSNNWTITSDGAGFASATDSEADDGAGYFLGHASNTATYITYSVNDNGNSKGNGVFVSSVCKFVEVKLKYARLGGSFSGLDFIFTNGSGNTYTLDLATWATTPIDLSPSTNTLRFYIPVFEHANWTGNIKSISIKLKGSFTTYVYLDYVRGCFDVRMADTNTSLISAGKQHFENTGDLTFLTANLPKYRRAMQFLISYMTTDGIIDLTKLQGHNGGQGYANSLISTYWDILSLAPNSSYVNALYYKALLDMAYLEDAATANGISVAAVTVKTTLTGGNVTYSETASSLRSKAAAVKSAITASVNAGSHTGYFKTVNSSQGYFIDGWKDSNQIDFQSVAFNLIMIDTGIATDEQAVKILNWMNAQGSLYDYDFAPRTNLSDIGSQKVWAHKTISYGSSVQNGGAILFVSYYDLLARLKYLGANNAYTRLSSIIDWYNDVKAAYESSGNARQDFYDAYYDGTGISLQGGGTGGTLGLDAEFIENVMLLSAIPDGFIGLDTHYEGAKAVLSVTPNLPDAIGAWKMEDVLYLGYDFDVYAGNSFVMIKSVNNIGDIDEDDAAIQVTLRYNGATPTVKVNGEVINSGYTVDAVNKTITYTTSSFTRVTISVE